MSQAYDISAWRGFFDAMLASTGAIFGLMVVAISFRVDSFQSDRRMIGRAAVGPIMILAEFIAMALALMPGQTTIALGIELIGVTAVTGIIILWNNHLHHIAQFLFKESPTTFVVSWIAVVPLLLGEIGLMTHALGGLFVMMIGFLGLLIASILGIWNMIIHHPNTLLIQMEDRINNDLQASHRPTPGIPAGDDPGE